jgi:predicted AAA+ superfamily ATPase
MKEILEDRRSVTSSQHLLGVLYGMRLLLEEACEVAEEPASFPREDNTYFPVHPQVLRGLRSLVSRRHRPERLRASIRKDAANRDRV